MNPSKTTLIIHETGHILIWKETLLHTAYNLTQSCPKQLPNNIYEEILWTFYSAFVWCTYGGEINVGIECIVVKFDCGMNCVGTQKRTLLVRRLEMETTLHEIKR